MRSHLAWGGFGLLLMAGCSAPSTTTAANPVSCVDAGASHHAYVVVQHLSGAWFERCVGFTDAQIDGQAVMDRSGIQYQARSVSAGKVVCQIDQEPLSFSACFPQKQPYWALFIESGGHWSNAPGGMNDVRLHDGDALGWHYVRADDPAPAPPPLPKPVGS